MRKTHIPQNVQYQHDFIRKFLREAGLYERLASSACHLLRTELAKKSINIFAIDWRGKSLPSSLEKLKRKSYSEIDKIEDRAGVRVICRYSSSIAPILKTVEKIFQVQHIEDTTKRGGPAAFGYASFHCLAKWNPEYDGPFLFQDFLPYTMTHMGRITHLDRLSKNIEVNENLKNRIQTLNAAARELSVELQVRTILQHAWASISHQLLYKQEGSIPEAVHRRLARLAAILEETDEAFSQEVEKAIDIPPYIAWEDSSSRIPLTQAYLKQYSADILGIELDGKAARAAYAHAQSLGLKSVGDFEAIMIATLEALEAAFSNILVRHLRSLAIYLDIVAYWGIGEESVLAPFEEQLKTINSYRGLVHEELLHDVLQRL